MRQPIAKKLILIVLLLSVSIPLRAHIQAQRIHYQYIDEDMFEAMQPGELASTIALSGLRAVAVDLLWLRITKLHENNDWTELLALLNVLGTLQPYNEDVWIFTAWNMAYNISLEQESIEDSWPWIQKGVDELEKGIARNSHATILQRYSMNILSQKIVNVDPDMRQFYTQAFLDAYGVHPLQRAVDHLDQAIIIEKQRYQQKLETNRLRLTVWYKCITLNRYLWWCNQEAAKLELRSEVRRELLQRARTIYNTLQDSLAFRQQLDEELNAQQRLDPNFLTWLGETIQYTELMESLEAAADSDFGSEERTHQLSRVGEIFNKIRNRNETEWQSYASEDQIPQELFLVREILTHWKSQYDSLNSKE